MSAGGPPLGGPTLGVLGAAYFLLLSAMENLNAKDVLVWQNDPTFNNDGKI